MTLSAESTLTRILLTLEGNNSPFILERLFYKDESWKVYTNSGFVIPEESTEPLAVNSGDFVDSFELQNGLYQYRIHSASVVNPKPEDYAFTCWTKFGVPDAVGYSSKSLVTKKDYLQAKETDMVASDTEAAAIARVCKLNNVDIVIIKGISDRISEEGDYSAQTEAYEETAPRIIDNITRNYLTEVL